MKRSERKDNQRKLDKKKNAGHGEKKAPKYTKEEVRVMRRKKRVMATDTPPLEMRQAKNKEEMEKKVAFWKKCKEHSEGA